MTEFSKRRQMTPRPVRGEPHMIRRTGPKRERVWQIPSEMFVRKSRFLRLSVTACKGFT